MRRIDRIVVLASAALTLLFYPQTYLVGLSAVEESCTYAALDRLAGRVQAVEAPDAGRTPVVFMFDDGWESVYTVAYPLLRSYGFRGSVAVIPSLIADKEYMSYPKLGELYLRGLNVLNHTCEHKENMYEDCQSQFMGFKKARDWMEKHRMPKGASTAVCPYGEVNPYLIQLLMKNGYGSVRTSDNILLLDRRTAKYLPVTTLSPSQSDTLDELEIALLASAKAKKPILLILHKLGDAPDGAGMSFNPNKLEGLLRFLQQHGNTFQVVPYSSLLLDDTMRYMN